MAVSGGTVREYSVKLVRNGGEGSLWYLVAELRLVVVVDHVPAPVPVWVGFVDEAKWPSSQRLTSTFLSVGSAGVSVLTKWQYFVPMWEMLRTENPVFADWSTVGGIDSFAIRTGFEWVGEGDRDETKLSPSAALFANAALDAERKAAIVRAIAQEVDALDDHVP